MTEKSKFKSQKSKFSDQAGVTLLLSMLILSGLTLITVSIGAFAIQQLRSSRAISVTEPAIGAAETGGEQGLWIVKRSGTLTNCTNGSDSEQLLNGTNTRINSCKSYSSAIFNLKGGTAQSFYLYDPNNIQGDVDLSGYPYSYLTISEVSGNFQVDASVSRLDGSTTGLTPPSVSATTGGPVQTINIAPVATGTEGRIRVTLQSSQDAVVQVNTDRGMPTYPTIDATGCSTKSSALSNCTNTSQEIFSRRINITVPQ
ncbi:MAG TPA: hypothetical protein VL306_02385 [Methylomirabilota bacterium]|nr:hypothetical protein [Methylomirabilota bacterium]